MVATRPLRDYEASPVSIILGALQLAEQNGDFESAARLCSSALRLSPSGPTYLVMTECHPDLDSKNG